MLIVKIFVIGLAILIGAILLNGFAQLVKLPTWYTFLQSKITLNIISIVWLFVAYPFLLGLFAYLASKLLKI